MQICLTWKVRNCLELLAGKYSCQYWVALTLCLWVMMRLVVTRYKHSFIKATDNSHLPQSPLYTSSFFHDSRSHHRDILVGSFGKRWRHSSSRVTPPPRQPLPQLAPPHACHYFWANYQKKTKLGMGSRKKLMQQHTQKTYRVGHRVLAVQSGIIDTAEIY